MICKECPKFDKELNCCGEIPSELENIVCLLRHICYGINVIYQEIIDDENEDVDWWKNS